MVFSRTGWRHWTCAILLLLSAVLPAASQGELTPADLALIGPPDLSSPRTTFGALQSSVTEAYDAFAKAYDRYRAEPGVAPSPEVADGIDTVNRLLRRAMATIDLSEVPAVDREQTGIEVAFLLGEVLDRLPPVDLDTIPDDVAVARDGITTWRLPHTALAIVRIENGPQAGEFLFSPESIAAARELYDEIGGYGGRVQAGQDLYRFYTLTPGDLLPPKYLLWLEDLPSWVRTPALLGHAPWQWVGIALVLLVLFGGWWLIVRAMHRRRARSERRPGFVARLVPPILLALAAFAARRIIVEGVNVSGDVLLISATVLEGIVYLAAAWAAYLVCAGIGEGIAGSSRIDRASIDASLLRVAARVLGIAVAISVIFVGATEIGLPLYGIIAGLGVGGLALGLAARPTLENLIGGFILYADRPVRVGEFCRFGDTLGFVEEIGLRSTRIRGLDRTLISIPNADFSNMELTNLSRRDHSLLDVTIGLREDTTSAQLKAILDAIRALLAADPDVMPDTARARLQEFGAYFYGIGIRAYLAPPHPSAFLEAQERILFAVMAIVEAAGSGLAFVPRPAVSISAAVPAHGESSSAE